MLGIFTWSCPFDFLRRACCQSSISLHGKRVAAVTKTACVAMVWLLGLGGSEGFEGLGAIE